MLVKYLILIPALLSAQSSPNLQVTMVGNAGVVLSDGAVSLLIDLPYQSGAHGYDEYDPAELTPEGRVVSVITHHHTDHFEPSLFLERPDWSIIGPQSVTEPLPNGRTLRGDSIRVGAFDVIAVPTPHTPDHRSYRIRWYGKVFLITGDTDSPAAMSSGPKADILFSTPWFSCRAGDARLLALATRVIAYHQNPARNDRLCGEVANLPQGSSFSITAE